MTASTESQGNATEGHTVVEMQGIASSEVHTEGTSNNQGEQAEPPSPTPDSMQDSEFDEDASPGGYAKHNLVPSTCGTC